MKTEYLCVYDGDRRNYMHKIFTEANVHAGSLN